MPKQAEGYAPDADAAADRAAQDTAAAEESAAQAEFSADYARNSAYQAAEARDRAQADHSPLNGTRKYGAYTEDADTGAIRGLIYAPFAQYVRDVHPLDAEVDGT